MALTHPHSHDHGRRHAPADFNRAFAIGVAFNVIYIVVEATYGVLAGSLALLADAGHNLSDVLGLLLAWGANYLVQRKPTKRHTYGWRKSTILAALTNAIVLLVAMGGIAWEAVRRFNDPSPVTGKTVIIVAAIGVVINTATALLFLSGRKEDLNIRGAFLHMAADAGVSAGVVVAGVVILTTGWLWIDPVVSLIITAIIVAGTWGLLHDSFNLALDAVPAGINPEAVKSYLAELPGVTGVHDLHIWAMSTSETALTVHLLKSDTDDDDTLIKQASRELHEQFGIDHITIQWERRSELDHCGRSCEI
ncbi:MAG: cation diffusion facilitator family transporter [Desulfobacterales bacterium]